jgi:hypothetical protein
MECTGFYRQTDGDAIIEQQPLAACMGFEVQSAHFMGLHHGQPASKKIFLRITTFLQYQ